MNILFWILITILSLQIILRFLLPRLLPFFLKRFLKKYGQDFNTMSQDQNPFSGNTPPANPEPVAPKKNSAAEDEYIDFEEVK